MKKTLKQIHEDVPADYYDHGIEHNLLQKIWHAKRFREVELFSKNINGKVLDIGCHAGLFTKKILDNSKIQQIYGIDISRSAISLAQKRIKNGKFFVADARSLPFKDDFFDYVFCIEMLEHVQNPQKVIREIKRVLKNNGQGTILVPTDNLMFKTIWFLWNLYKPVWNHAHIQSFNYLTVKKLLEKEKLKIIETKKFNMGMMLLIKFSKTTI